MVNKHSLIHGLNEIITFLYLDSTLIGQNKSIKKSFSAEKKNVSPALKSLKSIVNNFAALKFLTQSK